VAPVCSNCNGTDFVWANELKTGITGASLSLRARGEVPLGTRICRTCGHADLFLRDISILHQPHNWRPGEFVPIVAKPSTKPTHSSHAAAAPPPPPPSASTAPDSPPPPPPPPMEGPSVPMAPEITDPAAAAVDPAPETTAESPGTEPAAAKAKVPRRRTSKPKT
jgi:hypothetical protein